MQYKVNETCTEYQPFTSQGQKGSSRQVDSASLFTSVFSGDDYCILNLSKQIVLVSSWQRGQCKLLPFCSCDINFNVALLSSQCFLSCRLVYAHGKGICEAIFCQSDTALVLFKSFGYMLESGIPTK